jgi:hypothetical protein
MGPEWRQASIHNDFRQPAVKKKKLKCKLKNRFFESQQQSRKIETRD